MLFTDKSYLHHLFYGDYVDNWLPVVIYGSFGVAAAISDWFLPETKGTLMPETIDDGTKIAKLNC